ncbi:hypothetical protein KCU98_g69, partial [Aureobasidium melanogenum]
MASLTGLPPELRTVIYTYLLEDGLASGKRIVYCHDDDQYNDLDFSSLNQHSGDQDDTQPESEPVGWTRSAMQYTKNYQARITSLIDVRYTYGPDVLKRAIHHADVDDLLALASTCHRIRTEVLPLAWSNADITIYTPNNHFKDDAFHIFGRCLSSDTCALIRNIHIDVGTDRWSASDVSKTSNFIMNRLTHLKDLHVSVARESTTVDPPELDYGLRALTCLPCRTVVEVDAYIHPSTVSQEPFNQVLLNLFGDGTQITVYQRKDWEQAISLNDMYFFELSRRETQLARALRTQNEERHIDGSLLEDSLGLRSWMADGRFVVEDVGATALRSMVRQDKVQARCIEG